MLPTDSNVSPGFFNRSGIRPPWLIVLILGLLAPATAQQPNPMVPPETAKPPARVLEPTVPPQHARNMQAGLELFRTHVRAALIKHCLACHGGESVKADFDLSTRELLMQSGMVGKNAAASHLFSVITHAAEPHMPLKAEKLPQTTLAAIQKWLDLGAPYDKPLIEGRTNSPVAKVVSDKDREFWAFRPLAKIEPPSVQNAAWCRTEVDRFILAAQEARGLAPNASADRRTLIRRAYLDLIGLPPAPEQVEAFVRDPAPDAYEQLIDRLLQSPGYGERWARHWMDVARFAESHGYEQDYDRPHAYPYRDFLIWAFNSDLPYDDFIRWQLAGDELAPDEPWAIAATGFLGAGPFPTQLTEMEFESARYDELDDMAATTGVAFLGLSVGCARCHDHKFDPIPTADYYRLAANFTTTIRSEIEVSLPGADKPTLVQVNSEGYPHMKHHADGRGYPHFYPQTFQLNRGDVHQKQQEAHPGVLQVLMREGKEADFWRQQPPAGWDRTSFRRSSLGAWMTDPRYGAGHLAARVMVNRLWQHHFGRGLVATPNDFGLQGEPPSHPELLDWLARDLIAHGWRLKHVHQLLMTSAVYRQSNDIQLENAQRDPENAFLWRWKPRRLEAEAIRDSLLTVSAMLDARMYGPGTLDENMRRRSVYFFIKRSKLIPTMMLFDWPEHLVSIGARATTTTAPQALLFLNNVHARKYAEGLADRLHPREGEAAIRQAFNLAFNRQPTPAEITATMQFLVAQQAVHATAGKSAVEAARLAKVDLCQTLMSMNEFVYLE